MAASAISSSPCLIGPRMTVRGALVGEEDLVVEGRVEGTIQIAGHLVVADGGYVESDVEAESADIHGQVAGDVAAASTITLHPGAHVTGNLRAPRIVIDDGAHFHGSVDMDVDLPEGLARVRPR
ncbi:MAG: polymer-forming cytoskeletal protein [Myxococcales bacterium]|jgi:cytoskeletal protein CcmA (bactofilin family)|nr:polymer-forming cytoskeletal protein [Myxococcales bacterium]